MIRYRYRLLCLAALVVGAFLLTCSLYHSSSPQGPSQTAAPDISSCADCAKIRRPSPRQQFEPAAEQIRSASAPARWRPVATDKPGIPVFAAVEEDYAPWKGYDDFAFRSRAIQLDSRLISGEPLPKHTRLQLPLFDDMALSAEVANSFRNVNSTVSTRAVVMGTEWGRAVFAFTGGELQARILHPESGRTFGIEYNHKDGLHYLLEFDPAKLVTTASCGVGDQPPSILPPPVAGDQADAEEIRFLDESALADESTAAAVVDILAVYSQNALTEAGSVQSMENTLAIGIALANDAHSNTDTGIYFQLIHSELLAGYNSSGDNGTELNALSAGTGGYSGVHAMRDTYGADFVTAVSTVGGGIAGLLTNGAGNSNVAFSSTGRNSYASYTVAHEVGHNMGLSHAKDQNFQAGPTGGSIGDDAAGWHWHPNAGQTGYCSVLTYTGGNFFADGLGHSRVGLFSDPNNTHMGQTTGHALNGNNSRVLRALGTTYAAYRTRTTDPSPGIEIDMPNGQSWGRGSTQTITWESNGVVGNVKIELYKAGNFHSTIDANTLNDRIYYWAIPANLVSGDNYSIQISSVSAPAVAGVSSNFIISEIIFERNFDGAPTLFTATGDWQFGPPTAGNGNGGPTAAYTGTNIYDTILNGTPFAASSLLTAGPIDCSGFSDIHLGFAGQFSVAGGFTARVQVSSDGATWTPVETKSGSFEDDWTLRDYDISAIADDGATVYVQWSHTGAGGNFSGMAVDDVVLTGRLSRSLTYASTVFQEAVANDGSIESAIIITLSADTFTGALNSEFVGSKATVNNLPNGLAASLLRTTANTLTFSLSGNAILHEDIHDVSDLTVVFADSAFTDGNAATVPGSTENGLAINFEDALSMTLVIAPDTLPETGGTATATLTRNDPTGTLDVDLSSSDTTEATVPATASFAAGNPSTSFIVTAVDDTIVDGTQTAIITASAPFFSAGVDSIDITDSELLSVSLVSSIAENGGTTTATVTRPGTTGNLIVFLSSNDITAATVPATVTIPAGQLSAPFTVTIVDDNSLDGDQTVTITTAATGYTPASQDLTVTDYEPLEISNATPILESGVARQITLDRSDTTSALTVSLSSSDSTEATVPASVTFGVGEGSIAVTVTIIDDAILDGDQDVTITATASGWITGTATLTVVDHEPLTLAIADSAISESGGSSIITVTRTDTAGQLGVSLVSSDTSEASVPGSFAILAGEATGTVVLTAVDDSIIDGTQTVTLTASATGYVDGTDTVDITDHETLTIEFADSAISENGGSTIGTLTRVETSGALVVSLSSDDSSEATVPATITIPDAETSMTFAISAVDDSLLDGTQTVNIIAGATAYVSSSASLDVTDHEPLSISIAESAIPENGGSSSGLITRTDPSGDLSVSFASSDLTEAGNFSLIIPDGSTSASFTITAVDDDVLDGSQTVTFTASASGYEDASDTLSVTDHETLSLSFSPLFVNENSGPAVATATLTRSATNGSVTALLASHDVGEATVPDSILIQDGVGSVTFPIDAIDDLLADGDQIVTISATAPGYVDGNSTLTVTDDETLLLSITPESIAENAGLAAATGTVRRTSLALLAPVEVTLVSSDTSEATAAGAITIASGQSSASFTIDAIDDNLLDGTQTAIFTASATGFAPGAASVDISDHEPLALSIAADLNEDGGSTTGTVTRPNADQTAPLTVILNNPDDSEITIPTTVTIPANNASGSFSITAVDDSLLDGTQTVSITASSAGFVATTESIEVADDVVIIDVVAAPAEGGSVTGDRTVDPDSGPFAISATPNASHVFTAWSTSHGSIANDEIDSIPANATVTVTATFNARPVVTSVSISTPEDTAFHGSAPITDAENDSFTAILVSSPLRGALTLLSTGAYTYAPNPHYFGSDSFVFRANDGANSANDATVSITVVSVNDPPVLTSPSFSTAEDSPTTIDLTPYASDVEGSTISFDLGSPFTYTPPANANGIVTFQFIASDGEDSSVGTATVHIAPVNDPPVNTDLPSITGSPRAGETLSADLGTWNDAIDIAPGNLTYSYQWRRGPFVLGTAPAYTIPPGDRGKLITLRIIAIDDGEGIPGQATLADSATLTIENTPPVIAPFVVTVNEDNAATFSPNTSDADGDIVLLTLLTAPAHGSAGISGYTPVANFHGSDSFVIRADDGQGGITDLAVSVTVLPVADVPTAVDASFSTAEDSPLAIDLSPFASDDDGDTLSFSTGATFTYTPPANFNGIDIVPYTVSDGTGRTASATVSITVTPVNDAPIISPYSLTTNEDTSVVVSPTVTDADGDVLTLSPTSYTPDANFHGSDSFVFSASDGSVTSTVTVQVTVISVNDPPVAAGFGPLTLAEDGRVDFSLNVIDLDGDSVSSTQTSNPSHGTGTLTSYVPAPNYSGSDSYNITLDDGQGGITIVPVALTITPVNDLPVISAFSLSTDEDTPINFSPTTTDADGDTVTVSPTRYTPAPDFHGTDSFVLVADDGTGTSRFTVQVTVNPVNDPPVITPFSLTTDEDTPISFTPTVTDADGDSITLNQTSYSPAANFHGSDSFLLIADDGSATVTLTVWVTVNPVNDLPVIAPFSLTTDEDAAINFTPSATDADGDSVSFNQTSYTPLANFHGSDSFVLIANDGTGTSSFTVQVTVNSVNDLPVITPFSLTTDEDSTVAFTPQVTDADGDSLSVFPTSYTPAPDFHGTDSFAVIADDGTGTSSFTVAVTVNPVNDLPVITPFSLTTNEDSAVTFNPTVTDADNDTITLSQTSYVPQAEFAGTDSFTLLADDGTDTVAFTVTVTIFPINDPPVNTVPPSISGQPRVGSTLSASPGTWTDVENDSLSFGYEWRRNGAPISSGSSYQVVTADNTAELSIAVTADDGQDAIVAESATVSILNRAPVIPALSLTVFEDQSVNFDHASSDPDGDTFTVDLLFPAEEGTATTSSYAPNPNFNGVDTFTLRATDVHNNAATRVIAVSVLPANDPPVAQDARFQTAEDVPIPMDLLPFVGDIDAGDILSVSIPLQYTPPANFNGTDSFTYTVSDGTASAQATVTVSISPVNDAPIIPPFTITAQEDSVLNYVVPVSDADGDTPTLTIVKAAIHGTATSSTYTPAPEFSGTDRFTIRADDGNGGIANREAQVVVLPVNDLPSAGADFVNLAEEGSVLINALANDSDPEGDPLSILAVTSPDAAIEGDAIRYTPPLNFFGSVDFSYTLSDGSGTVTGSVIVNVTPVNDPPVIGSVSLTLEEDSFADFALPTSDIDGDSVLVTLFRSPAHGLATATRYTPALNFHGSDSFTLRWDDQHGSSGVAIVPVFVTAVNDPPVANSASYTTLEDTPLDIDLSPLASDLDGDTLSFDVGPTVTYTPTTNFAGTDSFTFTVSDGSLTASATVSLTIVEVNDPPVITPFSLTTDEDSAISFTPTASDNDGDVVTISPTDYSPAPNFHGSDSFDILADDGRGGTDRFTVVVTVNPVNDLPVIAPFSLTTDEDTPVSFTAETSDIDGDSVTVTPDSYTPAPDFFGTDSFVIVADDGSATVTFTVAVTVNPVFDPPINTVLPSIVGAGEIGVTLTADPGTWTADAALTYSYVWLREGSQIATGDSYTIVSADITHDLQLVVTATDSENIVSANSATLTVINRAPVIPALSLTLNENSSVTFVHGVTDPDGDSVTVTVDLAANHGQASIDSYTPSANYFGSDSFTLRAVDPHGSETTLTVAITILPINDPPVAISASFTTDEDVPLDIDLSPFASDVDNANLSFSIGPAFTYTPVADFAGTDAFTFTVSDGENSASATVHITIASVNDPPVTTDDSFSGLEDEILTGNFLANDVDPEGSPLIAISSTSPSTGSLAISVGGDFSYRPPANWYGTDSFTYTCIDSSLAAVTGHVFLEIVAQNDPPTNSGLPVISGNPQVGEFLSVSAGTWTDVEGDSFSYSYEWQRDGAAIATGTSYTTVTADNTAEIRVLVTASDGAASEVAESATLTILNRPPVIAPLTVTVNEDEVASLAPIFSDPDGDQTSLSFGSANNGIGSATDYAPAANYHGSDSYLFTVTDSHGASSSAIATITVLPVNDPPEAQDDEATSFEDSVVGIPVLNNDSDIDGDTLTVISSSSPQFDIATLRYSPEANFYGSDSFTYTISDGSVTRTATVQVTLIAQNDPPIVMDETVTVLEDGTVSVDLLANDSDADGDDLSVVGLATVDGVYSYSPEPNTFGTVTLSYGVSDGQVQRAGTLQVLVLPVNDPPVIAPFSLTTDEDTPVDFAPLVSDIDGDVIALSHTSYTPAPNFHGSDSFVLIADDGTTTTTFTVQVTVNPVNDPPVITAFSLTTDEDTPVDFTAQVSDVEGDPVSVDRNRYEPPANFFGADSFVITATDGSATSTFTVQVTVNSVNDPPVITPFSLTTDEDTPIMFTAEASDVEGDSVSVDLDRYEPAADFHGTDSFVIIASDGSATSALTVHVTVNPVNDPPVVLPFSLTTDEDTPIDFDAPTSDADGDTVTVDRDRYEPEPNFHGTDSFVITASDGALISRFLVVVTVNSVNDLPVITPFSLTTDEDTPIDVSPTITDVDNDPITLNHTSYTPPLDFHGSDSFVLIADDGSATVTFTVLVTVNPIDDPPVNSVPPAIIGTAMVGHTVSADLGTWVDVDSPLAFSYQWLRDGADIANATSDSYAIVDEDSGRNLALRVTTSGVSVVSDARQVGWTVTINTLSRGSTLTFGQSDTPSTLPAISGPISLVDSSFSYDSHIQPIANSATWVLHSNSDSDLVLTWSADALPASRYLSIYEIQGEDDLTPTGATASRIAADGTLVIPAGERWHVIRFDSVMSEIFVFRSGWNLFSIPVQPLEPGSFGPLWAVIGDVLVRADVPEAFRGYWSWQPDHRVVRVEGVPALPIIAISTGGNTIGVDHELAPAWDLLGPPLYWSPRGYRESSVLAPRRGYLIFSDGPQTLSW